ncbi:alpha/beta fold hydrolase [bacterium]|nr:alpha/beta fold hydrolase [bacterium]
MHSTRRRLLRAVIDAACLGVALLGTVVLSAVVVPAQAAPLGQKSARPNQPSGTAGPERPDYSALLAELDAHGSAVHQPSGVLLKNMSFSLPDQSMGGSFRNVEAVAYVPAGSGPWPGLLLIPGYGMSARDWADNGIRFSAAGYYCIAVSQPGMGASDGPADFVGPWTMEVLGAAFDKLKASQHVDAARLGVVGFSRGAIAASLLATRRGDIKAAVFGGGIYDLELAFKEIDSLMIRRNMMLETLSMLPTDAPALTPGASPEQMALTAAAWKLDPVAARQRSSLLDMGQLSARVLILHGREDLNAPISQAYLLRAMLRSLGKLEAKSMADFGPLPGEQIDTPGAAPFSAADFLLLSFDAAHGIGRDNFQGNTLDFLQRVL